MELKLCFRILQSLQFYVRLEANPFHSSIAVAEQLRENDRTMRKTQRDLTRDRGQLEKEEKRIVSLS